MSGSAESTAIGHTDDSYYFNYFFPIEKIPVVEADDAKLDEYIKTNQPCVIKNSRLVESAVQKWSLKYLREHLTQSTYHVFRAKSSRFLYWDDKKLMDLKDFKKPSESLKMTFQEFVNFIESAKSDDEYKYYLQQALNSSVDEQIMKDFLHFNWDWINERVKVGKWGELTSNLLLIGQPGNITPCHYDEQENFFAQVEGLKRCLLFPPTMFKCLYPFPVFHPCDRQCMVDLRNPDFNRFPKLKELKGYEAIVGPGDVLYLPTYWFHQIESLKDITTSINFWYKAHSLKGDEIVYPLKPDQKMSMMRNIERMVLTALQNYEEVPEFFETITLGRFTTNK